MFTPEERDRVSGRLVELACSDPRVAAAAFVGGSAHGAPDRWSDIDLTFGVAAPASAVEVLDDWSRGLDRELDAVHLFDVSSGPTVYRVFLLPGCLQVDLSFTPIDRFGAIGPHFELIFGETAERDHARPPDAAELFGIAVHHALRARICIERGRLWQAEYWLGGARDQVLALASLRHGVDPWHGRGLDALPEDVRRRFTRMLVRSLEPAELQRALRVIVDRLLEQGDDLPTAPRIAERLGELLA
jgi:hypothetical protein